MHSAGNSVTGFVLFLVLQIIFVIVFAVLGRYGKELLPPTSSSIEGSDGHVSIVEVPQSKYPRMSQLWSREPLYYLIKLSPCRFPRHPRYDLRGLRFPHDFPQEVRVQCYRI